jgi:micrococcal nuclease
VRTVLLCVAALTTLVACRDDAPPAGSAPPPPSTAYDANAVVERVVDGDTLIVTFDGDRERLRLIGIDTPESVKPDTPVECYGHEASARTADLLPPGTRLHVERDVEPRDDYGRLLGYVYRADDGLFVNDDLVRRGYARTLRIAPNVAHASLFAASADAARGEGLGLWGACR